METMRLVVQDYLKVIKESGELDAILPDLLREMRFRVIRPAFRGEVQHGVDIAATRKKNGKQVLFLFVLKAGDISSSNWDAGPNSVRPTLDTIQDAPFEDLTQADLRDAEKEVILAHNGALHDNINDRFTGYIENSFRWPFDRWGLDRLTEHFSENLLNERLLLPEYQRYLKRTLAFVDVPDYDLADFKEFVSAILPKNPRSYPQRRRYFGILRLALRMIYYYCQESGNLMPAVAAYEYALLRSWGWMYKNQLFTKRMKREHRVTFAQYLEVAHAVLEKIKPRLVIEDGLALGGTFEMVEYPLRMFRVIGDLGFLATVWFYMRDSEIARNMFQELLGLLATTIKNNRSRHRPLLDNHSIDIFLGMWPFLLARQFDFVKGWLEDILEHLTIRKKLGDRLPELYNNIGAVIEYEATNERPIAYEDSSSTLIYMLFELCLLLDANDTYDTYRPLSEDVHLQIWYPPGNIEELLYEREVHEGDTEMAITLPESFEEFRLDVEARHRRFDKWDYSPLAEGLPEMLLLANKHFRTPVFPFWWRIAVFGTERTEGSLPGLV